MNKNMLFLLLLIASVGCILFAQQTIKEAVTLTSGKSFEIDISNPASQLLKWDEPLITQSPIIVGIGEKQLVPESASTKYVFNAFAPGTAVITLNQRDTSKTSKPIVAQRVLTVTIGE